MATTSNRPNKGQIFSANTNLLRTVIWVIRSTAPFKQAVTARHFDKNKYKKQTKYTYTQNPYSKCTLNPRTCHMKYFVRRSKVLLNVLWENKNCKKWNKGVVRYAVKEKKDAKFYLSYLRNVLNYEHFYSSNIISMTEIIQHNYILFFSLQVAKNIMSKDPILTEIHSKAIRNQVSNDTNVVPMRHPGCNPHRGDKY